MTSLVGVTWCKACHDRGRAEIDAMFRQGRDAAATVHLKLEGLAELTLPQKEKARA